MDAALQAMSEGKAIAWSEAIDPVSHQVFYYNKETGATQWERPLEMGSAPLATGWFGRGKAGSNAAQRFSERNTLFLSRPAKKQKDFVDPRKYHTEGNTDLNIWYGRNQGFDKDGRDKEAAESRCNLNEDAGATKADASGIRGKRFFCLHFAHGMCAKGAECTFFHRAPTPDDDARCDEMLDCFGRARHAKHRDDMGGTGSFMKPSRTLFVGNLLKQKYASNAELEATITRHFEEWGELENCNVIHRLSIAFPRYRLRTSAEFAKEAMSCQSLDKGEILSIKWAHDDPNPMAQDSIARADKDALAALMQAKGISLHVPENSFEVPANYNMPAAKRFKGEELAYPDTDQQYEVAKSSISSTGSSGSSSSSSSGGGAGSAEQYLSYYQNYYYQYYVSQGLATEQAQSMGAAAAAAAMVSAGLVVGSEATASSSTMTTTAADDEQGAEESAPASKKEKNGEEQQEEEEEEEESSEDEDEEEEEEARDVWTRHIDPDTGAIYYYNAKRAESSWGKPGEGGGVEE